MFNPTMRGTAAGTMAGAAFNAQPVADYAVNNNLNLSPQQQLELQQRQGAMAANSQADLMAQQMGLTAGLASQAANTNAQRAMVLAAQQNAAQNVANQLNALSQARATNASMLANAMGAGAGMFR